MVHVCNHSTGEVEAGGSAVQGQPQLHSKLEANLDYLRLYLKKIYIYYISYILLYIYIFIVYILYYIFIYLLYILLYIIYHILLYIFIYFICIYIIYIIYFIIRPLDAFAEALSSVPSPHVR